MGDRVWAEALVAFPLLKVPGPADPARGRADLDQGGAPVRTGSRLLLHAVTLFRNSGGHSDRAHGSAARMSRSLGGPSIEAFTNS